MLKSAHAEPIVGRPGAAMPPADFAAAARGDSGEDEARAERGGCAVVPAVSAGLSGFSEARGAVRRHVDDSDARIFSTACSRAKRRSIEIERGKTLFVKYLTTGEVREDGTRTVFFELNGQPRAVTVADRSVAASVKRHPKADPDNADSCRGADAGQGVSGRGPARSVGQGRRAPAVD